jgi:hypothetical protein
VRRLSHALALLAVLGALVAPTASLACAQRDPSRCPCPMVHAAAAGHCQRGALMAAAMNCCRTAPAEAVAPASAGIGGVDRHVAAPQLAGEIVDDTAPLATGVVASARASSALGRRSPPDLCALHSVFRI